MVRSGSSVPTADPRLPHSATRRGRQRMPWHHNRLPNAYDSNLRRLLSNDFALSLADAEVEMLPTAQIATVVGLLEVAYDITMYKPLSDSSAVCSIDNAV